MARNARLEELWRAVRERARGRSQAPAWDDVTLAIARAVAEGAVRYVLKPNPDLPGADSYVHWVARHAVPFGHVIPVVPERPDAYADGEAQEAAGRREFLAEAVRLAEIAYPAFGQEVGLPTGQTTHGAITAYRDHVRLTYRDTDGRTTPRGEGQCRQIEYPRRHLSDVDLGEFGLAAIDRVIETIRRRPPSRTASAKGAKPISRVYARSVVKQFRQFVRWLHRTNGSGGGSRPTTRWPRPLPENGC